MACCPSYRHGSISALGGLHEQQNAYRLFTGHQNSPASPEATGLEVDKLNASAHGDPSAAIAKAGLAGTAAIAVEALSLRLICSEIREDSWLLNHHL